MATRLKNLRLKRVSLVDNPANEEATVVLFKSADDGCGSETCEHCAIDKGVLSGATRGDLSDSDFAAVWTDADGKKQRKLPIHDKAHVAAALSRLNQTDMPAAEKAKAKGKIEAAARRLGIGQGDKSMTKDDDDVSASAPKLDANATLKAKEEEDADDETEKGMCSKCMKAMGKGAAFCPNCGSKVTAKKGMPMDLDKLDPEVKKHIDKLAADLADAKAKLETATPVDKSKKPEEDVLKGLSPEVRAIVEKSVAEAADAKAKVAILSDTIEKTADENLEKAFVEEVKTFGNIPGDPKVLGAIFKRVSQGKTTKDDLEKLREVLKGANAAAKTILRVVGGTETGGSSTSAGDQLDTLAKEFIAKAGDKKPTYADAMDAVVAENPALWKKYQGEAMHTTVAVNEEE